MRLETRVSFSSGTEAVESIMGFFRRIARYTVKEADLVEMGSEEGRLPGLDGFLNRYTSV